MKHQLFGTDQFTFGVTESGRVAIECEEPYDEQAETYGVTLSIEQMEALLAAARRQIENPYVSRLVTIDGLGASFEAFVNKDRWNGWVIPYFSRPVAEQLVDHLWTKSNTEGWGVLVIADGDVTHYPDPDNEVSYLWTQFDGVNEGNDLVSIGGGSWCWEFDDEEEGS